jgi:hypothetical protein
MADCIPYSVPIRFPSPSDRFYHRAAQWNNACVCCIRFPDFQLEQGTGTIIMKEGIKLDEEIKVYFMQFRVEDRVHGQVEIICIFLSLFFSLRKTIYSV